MLLKLKFSCANLTLIHCLCVKQLFTLMPKKTKFVYKGRKTGKLCQRINL